MTAPISDKIAIASIATIGVSAEFEILKFSFELFHGREFHWFVRCDDHVAKQLSIYPKVHCTLFNGSPANRPDSHTEESQLLMAQKMNAINDALAFQNWEAVVYFDADIVVTSEFLPKLFDTPGDAILTPNYHPASARASVQRYGRYNAGFVFLRSKEFLNWWQEAYLSQPWLFSDQQCLNDAGKYFCITELGLNANVGSWRRDDNPLVFHPIPADCMFLHVHLYNSTVDPDYVIREIFNFEVAAVLSTCDYKPVFSGADLLLHAFSIHCLHFFAGSKEPRHKQLFLEILKRDKLGLYASILAQISSANPPSANLRSGLADPVLVGA